jgi:hypothetical protein
MKTKICRQCNKEFSKNRKYSITQWEDAKFCSIKCLNLSFKGKVRSEKFKMEKRCEECGNNFLRGKKLSKRQWYKKSFCSRKCQSLNKNYREKLRIANFRNGNKPPIQIGKDNCNWQGGISFNPYPREFNLKLKLKIRARDNFTCCLCKKTEREELEELNQVLSVNHIDFNKNNCKESNLNTLCLRCNIKINREREYWTNYFNQNG